ncbi:MAG: hypothetical protein RSG77_14950 [Hafnia sp.]
MSEQTAAYKENFQTMEQALRELETMAVPDVDAVLPLMDKFNDAYKKSMARIDQVEQLRNEMIGEKAQE